MKRDYQTREGELGALIARLELKSEVSAANLGRSARDSNEDIGGNRPSGGIDYQDDRDSMSVLKSADYFKRKRARCHTDAQFDRLIREIGLVLQAWQQMPLPAGQPPTPDDPQWKRWVAESDKNAGELARLFNMTRQHIYQIRKAYGPV